LSGTLYWSIALKQNRPLKRLGVYSGSLKDLWDRREQGIGFIGSQVSWGWKEVLGAGMEKEGDLMQGTLDMLVLKALARGAKHGYGVAEWIHESSNDVLHVEEGALYPALHRLELRGLLAAEWGASENNRRAKFYSLTAAGRKKLAEEAEYWRRMSGAIARVMQMA